MAHYKYMNMYWNDFCLELKCDICGAEIWTDITGKDFAEYIRFANERKEEHGEFIRAARGHGWKHRKNKDGKWIDICDECVRLYSEKKRQKYFDTADFEADFKEERNE